MLNFHYRIPTEIFFGKDQIQVLPEQVKKYGSRVLMVYGGGSIRKNGLYESVTGLLKAAGIEVFELPGVEPNPKITSVREGAEICKEKSVDLVLAVGGGSTLDCAKVIAAAALSEEEPWALVKDSRKISGALPVASIITLSATGSEMNCGAVISNAETKEKLATGHPDMAPKFSILDPTYTFTVPKYQTASGAADILCHVFEVYFSQTDAFLQNRLAEGVMRTVITYAPRAMADPTDYEARANIMWASSLAINGLLEYGKVSEWTMHGMEHELSAFYDITHGAGLAILMPRWMAHALKAETLEKFCAYAENVWGIRDGASKEDMALRGIEKTKTFLFDVLQLPETLKDVGIGEENLALMAHQAVRRSPTGTIGTFDRLSEKDILEIYRNCLS